VDAARADSVAARTFRADVERYLHAAPGHRDDAALRATLTTWRDNHAALEPILTASALGQEARPLSRDLSALGRLGLEALEAIQSGTQAPAAWADQARKLITAAARPRAELEIAVLPAVAKLALAASQLDQLRTMTPEEWNKKLDEQLATPRGREEE